MIRALVRKDWNWQAVMAVAGTIALLIAYDQTRFENIWVLPLHRGEMLYVTWWICAAPLGLVAATREEVSRTQEYLTHRPITAGQILTSKLLGCFIVLLTWLLVPALLSILLEACFGNMVHLIDLSNVIPLLLFAVVSLSLCAAGIFAATLPFSWPLRVLAAGCTGLVVILLGEVLTTHSDVRRNDPLLWLVYHVVMTASLIAASYSNVRQSYDPDLNPVSGHRTLTLTLATAFVTLAATWGFAGQQGQWLYRAQIEQPFIVVEQESGEYGLAKMVEVDSSQRGAGSQFSWEEVDADHAPIPPRSSNLEVWGLHGVREGGSYGVNEPRFNSSFGNWWSNTEGRLMQPDGLVYVLTRGGKPYQPAELQVLGQGPEHAPFSQLARPLNNLMMVDGTNQETSIVVLEPLDESLWKYTKQPGAPDHFVRIELPDDDRPVTATSIRKSEFDRKTRPVEANPFFGPSRSRSVVCSATNAYVFDGDAFRVAPDWVRIAAERRGSHRRKLRDRVIIDRFDLLAPTVHVTDPDNPEKVLFRHQFGARTWAEQFRTGVVTSWSMLRPPLLQIASYLQPEPKSLQSFGKTPYLDPLLAGSRRTWLLALNITLSIFLAYSMYSGLARRGAVPSTRRFWVIMILLLGPAAFWMSTWVEHHRAYRRPDTVPLNQAPPLLIHSS